MTRPLCRRVLVAGTVGALLALPVPTSYAASDSTSSSSSADAASTPLRVVIDRLFPSQVPQHGDVTVTGSVLNTTDSTWSGLSAYLLSSFEPITTSAELAKAVATDPATDVGHRIVEPGLFEPLPDLAAGESTRFRLQVPRSAMRISGTPGVYWLGVHVLGTSDGVRDAAADGRARTFLPLLPPRTRPTRLALGLQLRGQTVRAPDGTLEFPDRYRDLLRRDGRLSRLLAFTRSAGATPLDWVVDPAVVEAVGSVALGDPTFDTDVGPVPGTATSKTEPDAWIERRAAGWLDRFAELARSRRVLSVPYGDLDVASAYSHSHMTLTNYALHVSQQVLEQLGVRSQPVVAPLDGYLPTGALSALRRHVLAVLGPAAVPEVSGAVLRRSGGGRVVVAGGSATVVGPEPGAPHAALAVRQRLLSEAALHALGGDRDQPLVALLPTAWDPGHQWRRAQFFRGLDVPWLRVTGLGGLRPSRDGALSEEDVGYPDSQAEQELGQFVLDDAEQLIASGTTYDSVLVDVEHVGDRLARQALLGSAFWSRARPRVAAGRLRGTLGMLSAELDRISVRSPAFVTMSSQDGTFQVTLVNGLDERVLVGLHATVSGQGLQLTMPDPVTLGPRERRSLPVAARSRGVGIHQVRLQPTNALGVTVGAEATLSVRTSHVGLIIWLIMAAGSAALFGAIVVRITRRVLNRRSTRRPLLHRSMG